MYLINNKMKNYSKYIITRVVGPLTFVALGFTGLAWLTQSLRFVDLIINRGLGVGMFVYLSSLLLPSLISVVLPVALFAAVIFAFNRMTWDSEMIILSNAGLSRWQILRPVVHLSLIVMLIGYSIAFYVMPASYRKFKDMQAYIRDNYASVLLQEGVFNTMIEGLTVYVRSRDGSLLKGILVHDGRNQKAPVTMMAEEGEMLNTPSGAQFLLINGNRQEMNTEQQQVSILHFDRYAVELSMFNNPVINRVREAEERFLPELLFPEPNILPSLKSRLNVELHNRILWSFSALVAGILAASAFIGGQYNRRGQWRRILITCILCGGYFGGLLSLINALSPHGWAIMGAYAYVLFSLRFSYQLCKHNTLLRKIISRTLG